MRTTLALLAFALLLVPASVARAADGDAACCLQTTSRLNGIVDPVNKGSGDESFFTSKTTMPNVLMLIDESVDMHAWTIPWSDIWADQGQVAGCNSDKLNSLGFATVKGGLECSSQDFKNLKAGCIFFDSHPEFDTEKFYKVGHKGCMEDYGAPDCDEYSTADAACAGLSNVSECTACLGTTKDKGYYVDKDASGNLRMRVTGRFGQFYKPRDTMVRDLARDIKRVTMGQKVRQGFMTTREQTGGSLKSFPWYKASGNSNPSCVVLLKKGQGDNEPIIVPSCGDTNGNLESPLNMLESKMVFDSAADTAPCGFPLGDMIYAAAHFMRGPTTGTDPFAEWFGTGFPTATNTSLPYFNSRTDQYASTCSSCYFSAVVAITAGTISNEGNYVPKAAGLLNKLDSTENPCVDCTYTAKMAKWFWTHDLRKDSSSVTWGSKSYFFPGKQNMATYIVSLTDRASNEVSRIAKVGGGQVYLAETGEKLIESLNSALTDVVTRSTSFSAASVSFLQNATTTVNAIMPRMTPARAPDPWSGQLWHFRLFNEFVQETDLNNDNDKNDVFITDKNDNIISENEEGAFIKPGPSLVVPEDVDWEASNKLRNDGHSVRKIWTVRDSNNDGQLTNADSLVEFTTANLSTLLPYLGVGVSKNSAGALVGGRGGPTNEFYCPTFEKTSTSWVVRNGELISFLGFKDYQEAAAAVGKSITMWSVVSDPQGAQGELNELCGMLVIQYVRGQDLRDDDYDGDRTDTRPTIFGDIFHSSPVTVTAPVDAFLCDLGLSNQCVRTLYAKSLGDGVTATTLESYSENEKDCAEKPVTRNAYEKYAWTWRKRQELVLVGANDGMLHAFDNGTATGEACDGGLSSVTMNKGTGKEVWAFIPPDLLPKLADSVVEHTYLVDGDIMVRDIWNDDDKDGKKDYDEFRTIAVASEGRGGTHYFALELLFDATTGAAKQAPGFRWLFPQPCSEEASEFGKTLYSLSPKPPPIGPLLVDAETIATADKSSNPVTRYERPTQEQWMVALSGGWSPSLSLGRGVYFVDAYRGKVNGRNDNLWWKMSYKPDAADADAVNKPLREMRYSIVAPVALLDYGKNGSPALDGFFDTAIVGDTGGQVWLARMRTPGTVDATSKLINNWAGARAFEQDKGGTGVGNRYPIWFLASTAIQTDYGYLRAYFGGGDRYAVLEKYAGTCNFYNPLACVKYGCKDVAVSYDLDRQPVDLTAGMTWATGGTPLATTLTTTRSVASTTVGACGAATARYTTYRVNSCTVGDANRGELALTQVECSKPGSYYTCNRTDTTVRNFKDLIGGTGTAPAAATLTALGKPRFYGAWVYGGSRIFVEDGSVTTKTPAAFDDIRLTDSNLVDTTGTTCTPTGCTGNQATSTGNGWMVEYHDVEPTPTVASLEHKTATGAVVMSSCVLWNSLYPVNPTSATSVDCGVIVKSKGRFYQSDFISGAPNCAFSFLKADQTYARFQERNVLAPPPEPATVVQISKSGNIKYSAMLLEPGATQATEVGVSQSSDMLQTIYELPVSRAMHECRHGNKDNCAVLAP